MPGGAPEEVSEIHDAAVDVAANEICVHAFEVCRREGAARENGLAEPWGKAFDLVFDCFKHVRLRTIRDVAISPSDMPAGRGTRRIEQGGLSQQNKRVVGILAASHEPF